MNVFFQEVGTEDVLFTPREELLYIPNVGEDVYIEGTWYTAAEWLYDRLTNDEGGMPVTVSGARKLVEEFKKDMAKILNGK